MPLEIACKIAWNLHDVLVIEKMEASIVEIQALVTEYFNTPHWQFDEVISDALFFMDSPIFDVSNAHDFCAVHWMRFYHARSPLLCEIGRKMLKATEHCDVYCDSSTNNHEELEWFIAYYAHNVAVENMEEQITFE